MEQRNRRLSKYAALAFLAALATAAMAITYQCREIDGTAYRAVRAAFRTGSVDYRSAVTTAMQGGTISHWELKGLERQLARDGQPFIIDTRAANLREERVLLAATARWGASR